MSFYGYHSEWNLGSPGGWDYQRITQIISKAVWEKLFSKQSIGIELDFDHNLLNPLSGFVEMLKDIHLSSDEANSGLIAVVAEEETLEDVVENRNLVVHLSDKEGVDCALAAPQEFELRDDCVYLRGKKVSVIFMDFNSNVLLDLHRKHNLAPLLRAVKQGKVINPRGTEPINDKGMFEIITCPKNKKLFHKETIQRTPWTRQFYRRKTNGPNGESIPDLVEWTRLNWDNLVLKPVRGYSGKGVRVGTVNHDANEAIDLALKNDVYSNYIVQQKIPLNQWAEDIPEVDLINQTISIKRYQTDFRCLFGPNGLFGFLVRYGGVPTNVGSGGGLQPLAVLRSDVSVNEATKRINQAIMSMDYGNVLNAVELQKRLAINHKFTYLLGIIKLALRPRLITVKQMKDLEKYCVAIWQDCLTLEKMWLANELNIILNLESEERAIIRSQPWLGSPAIFASDGLFSFGAHLE
jgi:hypothetical protein